MPPSEKVINAQIKTTVSEIFHGSDRELLTVRKVRDAVEEELGLEKGFLAEPGWKDKCKKLIQDYSHELMNAEEAAVAASPAAPTTKKPAPPAKQSRKRASPPAKAPPRKRQKKAATPSDDGIDDSSEAQISESEAESSFGDSESDAPKSKGGARKNGKNGSTKRSKKQVSESESDDMTPDSEDSDAPKKAKHGSAKRGSKKQVSSSEESDAPKKKSKPPPKAKTPPRRVSKSKANVGSDSDEVETEVLHTKKQPLPKKPFVTQKSESDDEKKETHKSSFKKAPTPNKDSAVVPGPDTGAGSESEMSVVLDITPPQKRTKTTTTTKAAKSTTTTKSSKSKAAPKATAELSPDEQTLKTLQSQLRKCGIQKIWQFELKPFDTPKEKINHLKEMLHDVGMTGRFSDTRAKEIKEQRELMHDLEAVKEGEKNWGLGRGARRGGAKEKSFKGMDAEDEEDDDSGEEDADGEGRKRSASIDLPSRAARSARADLAFLGGDDEESD